MIAAKACCHKSRCSEMLIAQTVGEGEKGQGFMWPSAALFMLACMPKMLARNNKTKSNIVFT